jgi:hypothetical protein
MNFFILIAISMMFPININMLTKMYCATAYNTVIAAGTITNQNSNWYMPPPYLKAACVASEG